MTISQNSQTQKPDIQSNHQPNIQSNIQPTIQSATQLDIQIESESAQFNDLDLEHLHEISDNSRDFEIELLQLFVEDSLNHLMELSQALAMDNFGKIEQCAHHLKGSSSNVGAKTMHLAAEQVERLARSQHADPIYQLLRELEDSLDRIQQFVAFSSL